MFSSIAYPVRGGKVCPAAMVQMHQRATTEKYRRADFTPLLLGNIRELSLKEIWDRMTNSEDSYKLDVSPPAASPRGKFWTDNWPKLKTA